MQYDNRYAMLMNMNDLPPVTPQDLQSPPAIVESVSAPPARADISQSISQVSLTETMNDASGASELGELGLTKRKGFIGYAAELGDGISLDAGLTKIRPSGDDKYRLNNGDNGHKGPGRVLGVTLRVSLGT